METTHEAGRMRFTSLLLVACFLVGISLPLLDAGFGFAPRVELTEKRAPTPRPGVPATLAEAKSFPKDFESWFDDHFGFRGPLVRTHNRLKAKVLRTAPSSDVVIGKDGWLYLGIYDAIDQYRAIEPMPPALLESWRRRLEECHEYCADRGEEFLFVISPNKVTIYPEHLPAGIEPVGAEGRHDQLLRYLRENSHVRVLDLRPALLAQKEADLVYHVTDSHWSPVGALAGWLRMAEELRRRTPSVPDLSFEDFRRVPRTMPGGDLTNLMAIPDLYEEEVVTLVAKEPFGVVRTTVGVAAPGETGIATNQDRLLAEGIAAPFASERDDPSLPRLVMFRDSFGEQLIEFVATGFSRGVYYWQYQFDPEVIIAEDPDVVIQQVVERTLMRDKLPPNPAKISVDFERRRRFRAAETVFAPETELDLAPRPDGTARIGYLEGGGVEARGLLRVAVTSAAPATVAVVTVAADDPDGPVVEIDARVVSAGLEVLYFDIPALPSDRRLAVGISGAAGDDHVVAELRAATSDD